MKRASYAEAIAWIANNDDEDLGDVDMPVISIAMVADLWGKDEIKVYEDVVRYRRIHLPNRA